VKLEGREEPLSAKKSDLTLIPSTDADVVRAEDDGYIVDYRESDGAYRIVFDDIKDVEDANYWYKREVDWYKRDEDFEVV